MSESPREACRSCGHTLHFSGCFENLDDCKTKQVPFPRKRNKTEMHSAQCYILQPRRSLIDSQHVYSLVSHDDWTFSKLSESWAPGTPDLSLRW